MPSAWIEIGTVSSVNAARRELRVDVRRKYGKRLSGVDRIHVKPRNAAPACCRVIDVRAHGSQAIVRLTPGVTRDEVALMKGAVIVLDREELAAHGTGPDEYELEDLIAMRVTDLDGKTIGTVDGAYETGANDVIEVKGEQGEVFLLPVIPELMKRIDLVEGCIQVGDTAPYAVDV